MLQIDVKLAYDKFALNVKADINNKVVGLLGPSGSGKTTLLNLLAGLQKPDKGKITLDGRTLFDSEKAINIPSHQRRIGVVFQDCRLFPHYTVKGNLLYGNKRSKNTKRDLTLDHVSELLDLVPLLDRRIQNLSGGQRQRVALGRALLSGPSILLMDEPLAALDNALKQQILPFLQRVRDHLGIPIVYISHDIGEILQLTDHLMLLDNGKLIGSGHYCDLAMDTNLLSSILPTGLPNVIEMTVTSHDRPTGCTTLTADTLQLHCPLNEAIKPASKVSVTIRPEDIILSNSPVDAISARNHKTNHKTHRQMHTRNRHTNTPARRSKHRVTGKIKASATQHRLVHPQSKRGKDHRTTVIVFVFPCRTTPTHSCLYHLAPILSFRPEQSVVACQAIASCEG